MNLNTQWQTQHRQLPSSPQQHTQQVYLDTSSINYLIIHAFHSLPHLNMWFEFSNSTFDPNSSDYLETILFWSTMPILLLIFILLILIIYACGLVVITNSRSVIKLNSSSSNSRYYKKHSRLCTYRFVISMFVMFLATSVAFIVYGSEKFHESFSTLTVNIRNFSNYFGTVGNQASFAKESIAKQINTTLLRFEKDLKKRLDEPSSSSQTKLINEVMKELANVKLSLNESYNALEPLNQLEHERTSYAYMLKQFNEAEQIRWAIMIGVVTVNTLLIALLIIGLIRNSKGSLCFFAFAGVLSLISIWILNALYLGITVFISDYCTSPDQYILTVAEKNQMKNLVQYFTTCTVSQMKSDSRSSKFSPYKQDLNRVYSKLRTALTQYNDNLERMSKPLLGEETIQNYHFPEAILAVENTIDKIAAMLKCDHTSESYRAAVNTLCTNSVMGLAIIVIASVLFGLIMPMLICITPQMWRRMHKKDAYDYHYHHHASAPAATHHSSSSAAAHNHVEESHPFISLNNVPSPPRTNFSATRQFNESPNFQRLTAAQSSTNSNHNHHHHHHIAPPATTTLLSSSHHTNSLSRSRYNQSSANPSTRMNTGSYAQTLKLNTRLNEYVMNHEPYLLLGQTNAQTSVQTANQSSYNQSPYNNPTANANNSQAFPSAPPSSQNGLPPPPPITTCGANNYMLHHTSSNVPNNGGDYNKYATGLATTNNSNSMNVPIVLYPNYSTRTLLGQQQMNRRYDASNVSNGAYGTLSRNY